jgi:AcrR family transcriptional regulator
LVDRCCNIDDVNIQISPSTAAVNQNIYIVNIEESQYVKTTRRSKLRAAGPVGGRARAAGATVPYHHGSLREAMLQAAEHILERDGIAGLTLRAAARGAGVSHAAPKNHFGDIRGLLSELAAVGFARFSAALVADTREDDSPTARMAAIGYGYVAFARQNPGLFLLMFRGERLDFSRPALREAAEAAFGVLAGSVAAQRHSVSQTPLGLAHAAQITAAWSLVHGFAMLMLDGRLKPLIARMQDKTDEMALLAAILRGPGSKQAVVKNARQSS